MCTPARIREVPKMGKLCVHTKRVAPTVDLNISDHNKFEFLAKDFVYQTALLPFWAFGIFYYSLKSRRS